MPTGERTPDGVVNVVVEYLADVYTEAIKPMYAIVVGVLVVVCLVRLIIRVWKRRRQGPVTAHPEIGPDPPIDRAIPLG